ncbi:MAG TPA: intradiol ring-cleavage dioxygenase [Gemmatimonadaceae bacterium]|nr:intradiol ring-cleavage dioxygenase [Gemmatimonadaceae bacterium]
MADQSKHPASDTAPINRRELLGRVAMAATTLVVSQTLPAFGATREEAPAAAAGPSPCVLTAPLEEGPFFVDEKLNRSDIRSDPVSGAIAPGVPLEIAFNVARASGATCAPLTGAYLDVWHCDAGGVYSDESEGGPRTRFLRGYQVTDGNGAARFTTIYPGWYPGRTVHIHFKLRLPAGASSRYEFTSQFFFDEALTAAVHAAGPYSGRGRRDTFNTDDRVFLGLPVAQRSALTLATTKADGGYRGAITLTVAVA